jgi:lactate permease
MPLSTLALAGSLPIVAVLLLMVWLRWPAARAMAIGWAIATALGLALWRMPPGWWAAAALYGALQALDIILIVFGAILLMNHLQASGAIAAIRAHFGRTVEDARIQLLLIGLGFMTLIEGVAGFGTPGALGAPLLTGLGFTPLAAAAFGLLFNAPNPPLGAAGVPVNGGIGSVIDEGVLGGALTPGAFLRGVAGWTGVFTGSTLAILGLLGVFLLLYWFGHDNERSLRGAWRGAQPAAPFALTVGALAGLAQFLMGWFVGPELPTAVAGLVALGVGLWLVRRGYLLPRVVWRLPENGAGALLVEQGPESGTPDMPVLLAWAPYMLVVLLLFVTRMPGLGLREALQGLALRWERVLGQEIAYTLRPLYIPGVMPFMPVAILTAYLHRMAPGRARAAWGRTLRQTARIALTLLVAVSMAQIMIRSATNPGGLPGMMQALSLALAQAAGQAHPFVAPWLGALGAFMTGSSTSSNILFSVVQHDAAASLGLPRTLIVALQNAGSGLGNMVSVLNIAAVCGVLGLRRVEGDLLRRLLVPTVILAALVGLGGLLLAPLLGGLY